MEQFPIRYPQTEHRRYTPGSKGLNKHYKAHRVQFFGQKGIIKTEFRTIHRNPSVGMYTDQRGIPSFAYKIPDGKMYKTAPQMDKLPRGGNVPRVVGTLGDVFQDVVDQGTPGAASILRNGDNANTPTNLPVAPSTSTAEIQGSQALGSNLSLVGSGTDVYQTAPESLVENSTNVYRAPSESDHDMDYSPSIIITNPADEKTSRLPGVHQETIDYADGDAQPGYRKEETTGTQTAKTIDQEMKDLDRRMDQQKTMGKRIPKRIFNEETTGTQTKKTIVQKMKDLDKRMDHERRMYKKPKSNAEKAIMTTGSQTNKTKTQEMNDLDKRMDQNNFNPLQNADRIVPSTETFITFPGPPRLQYMFQYGPASRKKITGDYSLKYQRVEIPAAKKQSRKNR
jgi:hypothetical protein